MSAGLSCSSDIPAALTIRRRGRHRFSSMHLQIAGRPLGCRGFDARPGKRVNLRSCRRFSLVTKMIWPE